MRTMPFGTDGRVIEPGVREAITSRIQLVLKRSQLGSARQISSSAHLGLCIVNLSNDRFERTNNPLGPVRRWY